MSLLNFAKSVFGSSNDRRLKSFSSIIDKINLLEPEYKKLDDQGIIAKTNEFKKLLQDGEKVDNLLVRAFALVREAAKRALGQRPYDVQLLGGIVLHHGGIAEMKTGEGKTLVATMPAFLNALSGKGVHIITVNDYLAKRDADWMSRVYETLGMTTGCIINGIDDEQRKAAYQADITYGTNNEFGFDYLRDNMKLAKEKMVGREKFYAIIDEVDSILIDEARTPLVISGPTDDKTDLYNIIDKLIPDLAESFYEIDEKQKTVTLTDEGNQAIEDILYKRKLLQTGDLYDAENVEIVHHLQNALKANKLFNKDKDYIVRDDKIHIIDEFTGRMMEGRRWSEGLHQAIEAKENVFIQPENQTLASITYQNYFRLYKKLSGMTGTAMTEEAEFAEIYNLQVSEIPTNRPLARKDADDELYMTAQQKYKAIIAQIATCVARNQPVLVGTVSIENSEVISKFLKDKKYLKELVTFFRQKAEEIYEVYNKDDTGRKAKEAHKVAEKHLNSAHFLEENLKNNKSLPIAHNVLNARYHEQEAQIIAKAGEPAAVTIATNMAGRGTDIQLGGSVDMQLMDLLKEDDSQKQIDQKRKDIEESVESLKVKALEAGGLFVLGTERHESRRIDNQLRGRSGRQGDPGATKFFLSLEDDLMRIFGAGIEPMLKRLGIAEDESIEHPWFSKAIETAQKKVEERNFDIRKNILKYDDVVNEQRKSIFEQRNEIIDSSSVSDIIEDLHSELIEDLTDKYIPKNSYYEKWNIKGLSDELLLIFQNAMPIDEWAKTEGIGADELIQKITEATSELYERKKQAIGEFNMVHIEKLVILQIIDNDWRDHLHLLDYLRSVVGLRAHGQRDPLNEFKSEAFSLFEGLLYSLRKNVISALMRVSIEQNIPQEQVAPLLEGQRSDHQQMQSNYDKNTPRNSPCPCGSGLKYKHCHGKL